MNICPWFCCYFEIFEAGCPLRFNFKLCRVQQNIDPCYCFVDGICASFSWCYILRDSLIRTETRLCTGKSRASIAAVTKDFSLHQNVQTSSGAHSASCSVGTEVLSQESSGQGVRLTTHLHLVQRLRTSGAVSPHLALYAAMVWRRKTLFFY